MENLPVGKISVPMENFPTWTWALIHCSSYQPLKQGFGDKTLKFFLSSPINQSWQDWDCQQTLIRHDQGLLLGFGTLDSYQNHKTIFYYKYSFLCLVLKSLILMQFEYKRKYEIILSTSNMNAIRTSVVQMSLHMISKYPSTSKSILLV